MVLQKADELSRMEARIDCRAFVQAVKRHRVALSVRQSAEWGMGAMQSMCGRLQHRLPAQKSKRRLLLDLATRYFNFRTCTCRFNQISTVYSAEHTSAVLRTRMSHYYTVCNNVVY